MKIRMIIMLVLYLVASTSAYSQNFSICGDKANYSPVPVGSGRCQEMGQYVLTSSDWFTISDILHLNVVSLMIDGPTPTPSTVASKEQLTMAANNDIDVVFEWSAVTPVLGAGTYSFPLGMTYEIMTLEFQPESSVSFTNINTNRFTIEDAVGAYHSRSGDIYSAIECEADLSGRQTVCEHIDESSYWSRGNVFPNFSSWDEVAVRLYVPYSVDINNQLITVNIGSSPFVVG